MSSSTSGLWYSCILAASIFFSFLAQLTSTRELWRKLAFPRIVIWRQGPVRLRFSLHQDANLPVLKWTSTGGRTEAAQGVSLQRANFVPIAEAPLPRTSEVSSEPISISTLYDWVDSSAHSHFFLKCTPAYQRNTAVLVLTQAEPSAAADRGT